MWNWTKFQRCLKPTDLSLIKYFRAFGANFWLTFGQMTITINNCWSLFTVLAIICGAFCPGCTVSWCRLNLILQPGHFQTFSNDQEHSWDQCKSEEIFWRGMGWGCWNKTTLNGIRIHNLRPLELKIFWGWTPRSPLHGNIFFRVHLTYVYTHIVFCFFFLSFS